MSFEDTSTPRKVMISHELKVVIQGNVPPWEYVIQKNQNEQRQIKMEKSRPFGNKNY